MLYKYWQTVDSSDQLHNGEKVLKESSYPISFTSRRSLWNVKEIYSKSSVWVSESSSKMCNSSPNNEPSEFERFEEESSKYYVFVNKHFVNEFQIY